ncbi:hypothetical protein VTO42DRAFT_709 [Malbranchea cinnamomea]
MGPQMCEDILACLDALKAFQDCSVNKYRDPLKYPQAANALKNPNAATLNHAGPSFTPSFNYSNKSTGSHAFAATTLTPPSLTADTKLETDIKGLQKLEMCSKLFLCESPGRMRNDDHTSRGGKNAQINEGESGRESIVPHKSGAIHMTVAQRAISRNTDPDEPSHQRAPLESEIEQTTPKRKHAGQLHTMSPSSGRDSDGSDEVVLRKDEYHMVGPRLRSLKPMVNLPASASPEPNSKNANAQGEGSVRNEDKENQSKSYVSKKALHDRNYDCGVYGAVTPADTSESLAPLGVNTDEKQNNVAEKPRGKGKLDVKEDLRRIQEAEKIKFRNRQLGVVDGDGSRKGPLYLARQGPGTDPTSAVCQGFARLVAAGLGSGQIAKSHKSPTEDDGKRPATIHDPVKMGSVTIPPLHDAVIANRIADKESTNALVVDWQYRPWQTYGDEHFVNRFRFWLENTIKLGYPVDTNDESFRDGTGHMDGIAGLLKEDFGCGDTYLDQSDQENVHAHETAIGYVYNWNLRLQKEEQEVEMKKRQKATRAQAAVPTEPHPHAPKVKVYLRPVERKDISHLVKLYNWYLKNSTRVTDLEEVTENDMQNCILECQEEKLPFLVAVEQTSGLSHAMDEVEENIYGFIAAYDFAGRQTIYHYTAELELFVHPGIRRHGVGRCLLDRMLQICDPKYLAKNGYYFGCPHDKREVYCGGQNRYLSKLIFTVHYAAHESEEYKWLKQWLEKDFGFEEQGLLKGAATKDNKLLNTGYLVYSTCINPITGHV